jgi:carboxypeptidase Q
MKFFTSKSKINLNNLLPIIVLISISQCLIPGIPSNLRSNTKSLISQFNTASYSHTNSDDKYTLAMKIINETISFDTRFKHQAWESTAYLVDTFGPRLFGSQNLDMAIEFMYRKLQMEGFENVRLDKVEYKRKWIRGDEHLFLLSPRPGKTKIPMTGLGKTEGGNVTAEVVLIETFEELDREGKLGNLKGKIVFLNPVWTTYKETKKYRKHGPALSSKFGAVGVVLRSITPHSLETVHTGGISEDNLDSKNIKNIPAAAISLETADMFKRMIKRGQKVVLNLYMEAKWEHGSFTSHNLIGEIRGSKFPDEIIIVGGHMDSWDNGPQTGALDDGAGMMVCYEAVRLLIQKGLKPLRTIRFIGWTGEEFGKGDSRGADNYAHFHQSEMEKHIVAFESDMGTMDVYGFGFTGGNKGYNLVKMISQIFFKGMKADLLRRNDGFSSDINPIYRKHKVPIMRTLNVDTKEMENYFTYYHSAADSMNILNPDDLDRNVCAIASMFFILADVPWKLPRD